MGKKAGIEMGKKPMDREIILIIDFGAQYNQLIARRVREAGVYCEVLPYDADIGRIRALKPKGLILTGGPASVLDKDAPSCDPELFRLGVPILGICYGMQLMAVALGGGVERADSREYGKTLISLDNGSLLFTGLEKEAVCWMSHTYFVRQLPQGFISAAGTGNTPNAAMEDRQRRFYGVQFHPEVIHTPQGGRMLGNFLYNICGCAGDWKMSSFASDAINGIREKVGDGRVICALSGGVDSSVAAVLVNKAVGRQLSCIFVDHGLLRKHEAEQVEKVFKEKFDMDFIRVNASERFLSRLNGVTDPERKRKIIGEEFIRTFEDSAKKLGKIDYLVQGTIYPDVIESGKGNAAVIKSHHNVGGLPADIGFKEIIEPLKSLFKDEVRKVGEELGIPGEIVWRQPFPGPGLAIRIIGDVTAEKLNIVKDSDHIFRSEIAAAGIEKDLNQYFTVLTGIRSVGVMGDERSYDYTVALRAVCTTDFMTADWARIPYDILEKVSGRIVNEVKHVNRVVYDITSKPPASIEWE